jgi:hypothetical protein
LATTNANFKVKNGLDASGDISTTANLYANKTSFASNIVSSGPGSITYWKIATLPVSSAGTYDHLIIDAVLDDNWGSDQKVNTRILFSNRNAFTYRYYLNGTVRSAARVLAYRETDTSISIYLRAGSGNFCSFSYNITHGLDNGTTVIKNPASTTTTPSGTLVFDSSNVSTYVPESYIPYSGQPVIRGLVNSSGAVSGASFVRSGGTSAQFLKADGSVDSNTYLPTTSSYFAGHHPEGRVMHNAYLTNDLANARLRGATVSATQNGSAYTISNTDWDAMFSGRADFLNISPTSGFTFPLVLTVSLPRTLTYGTWVGIGFGNSGWRANSVKIEVFSLNSSTWVTVVDTASNTSEDVFAAVSGLSGGNSLGINQIRYTLSAPNSTQLRIAHLWAYNFNSDMWSQTMMPRAGGSFYGPVTNTTIDPASVPLIVKGAASQTANVFEIKNSSNSVMASLAANNTWLVNGIGITAGDHRVGTGTYFSSALSVQARATTEVGAVVRGASGQTADLLQIQNSTPSTLLSVSSNGSLTAPSLTVSSGGTYGTGSIYADSNWGMIFRARTASPVNAQYRWANSADGELMRLDNSGRLIVSNSLSGSTQGTAQIEARAVNATTIGAIIRGATSQSANLQEWQTSTPTTVASISATGAFTSAGDITAENNLRSSYSSGDEGGQIFLNKAVTNTTLVSGVNIDVYQNKLRFWEDGGNNRGFYIDMTTGANSVGTNLVGGGSGTVTSVAMTVPTGLSISGSPITSSGTLALTLTSGYSIPTTSSQANWDTAFTDRNKWDGGSTGLTASTGRTSLGATTVGSNIFTLTNPSAISWLRVNADNTVTARSATDTRTDLGLGTMATQSSTSPSITTSITTPTTGTFDLINTTATTVNFAGAATTLNIGTGSITKTINLGTSSASTTTVNIGTSATSSSTINLQATTIDVGRNIVVNGTATGVNAFIYGPEAGNNGTSGNATAGHLYIRGGGAYHGDEFNTGTVTGGNLYLDAGFSSTLNGTSVKGGVLVGTTTDTGSVTIGRTGVTTSTPGAFTATQTVTGGNLTTGGTLTRTSLSGGGTTGASINDTGAFIRTASSARYKQDIADAAYSYEDILGLSPKTFRLKEEAESNPNARVYGGLIAEDVHELESLRVFVNYKTEDDGSVVPDGIAYGEMVSALVSALKYQDAIIKSLETRIQALENN